MGNKTVSSPTNRLLFSEQKERDVRLRALVLVILFAVIVSHLLAMTAAVAFDRYLMRGELERRVEETKYPDCQEALRMCAEQYRPKGKPA